MIWRHYFFFLWFCGKKSFGRDFYICFSIFWFRQNDITYINCLKNCIYGLHFVDLYWKTFKIMWKSVFQLYLNLPTLNLKKLKKLLTLVCRVCTDFSIGFTSQIFMLILAQRLNFNILWMKSECVDVEMESIVYARV